jgi:hypothetical protein
MNCCGRSRAQASLSVEAQAGTVRVPVSVYGSATFEYMGRSRLSVIGPVTRATYIFDGPGARVAVDGRDGVSLATVRMLRRV